MNKMDISSVFEEVSYQGDDTETQIQIAKSVSQLPEDVIWFVIEHCVFMSVGRADYGLVMPPDTKAERKEYYWAHDRWLIFLTDDLPEKDALGIIAHEIAHAYLGHDRQDQTLSIEIEEEAANLTKAWGFSGRGTSPGIDITAV